MDEMACGLESRKIWRTSVLVLRFLFIRLWNFGRVIQICEGFYSSSGTWMLFSLSHSVNWDYYEKLLLRKTFFSILFISVLFFKLNDNTNLRSHSDVLWLWVLPFPELPHLDFCSGIAYLLWLGKTGKT